MLNAYLNCIKDTRCVTTEFDTRRLDRQAIHRAVSKSDVRPGSSAERSKIKRGGPAKKESYERQVLGARTLRTVL